VVPGPCVGVLPRSERVSRVNLQSAFENDLSSWLAQVYDRLETVRRRDRRAATDRIIEQHNRLLIALVAMLGASTLLLPIADGLPVIVALAVLYLGATIGSVVTAVRVRSLDKSAEQQEAVRRRREIALLSQPPLGLEERAQLIRIFNLSRLGATARRALEHELIEARNIPGFASWQALDDAAVLVRDLPAPTPDAYLADEAALGQQREA
jgi:hypothetical protein